MNYYEILTLITLFFLLVTTVFLGRYRRKYHLLIREHRALSQKNEFLSTQCSELSNQCSELNEKIEQTLTFKNNLADAEITTRLQATRTGYQAGEAAAAAPERYNYINALSQSGMEPEKIAELLSISVDEAQQLVCLSKLTNQFQPT